MRSPRLPIVVTGATGGLGRHAVQALRAQGWSVRATGRRREVGRQLEQMGAQFVPLDLGQADPAALDELLLGAHAVWHLAARSAPWGRCSEFMADNLSATQSLLDAAARQRVPRFIHVSTPAVYFDFQHRLNVEESFRPARFVNHYAASKAAAEQAVLAVSARHGIRSVILRPRAIFGPHDQVLLPRLMQARRGRSGTLPLPRGGRALLDLTYVGNVVHALELATVNDQLPSGLVCNITNHEPQRLCDVLRRLFAEHLDWPLRVLDCPHVLLAGLARGMEFTSRWTGREPPLTAYGVGALHYDLTLSNRVAQEQLGYTPRFSLAEGLARTAAWLLERGV